MVHCRVSHGCLFLHLIAILVVAGVATGCSDHATTYPAGTDTTLYVPAGLSNRWAELIDTYRLSYIGDIVDSFGLDEADLSGIDVVVIDPKPWSAFASTDEYDLAFAQSVASCLRQYGYPAQIISAPEGPGVDVPGVRIDDPDYRKAHGLCIVKSLLSYPPRPQPVTTDEWRERYDEQVTTAECLALQGYPGDVPSFEKYMDNPKAWIAYDAVPVSSVGPTVWATLNEECPQP